MPHTLSQIPATWAGDLTVTGADLSTTVRAKSSGEAIPTVPTAAGTIEVLMIAPFTGTVFGVRVAFKDALAAHDTNFVTFALVNKGQAGAGSTAMLATTPAGVNTTKVTGGAALSAYTTANLTLNTANAAVTAGDCLAFQVTGAGTLANTLTEGRVQALYNFLT